MALLHFAKHKCDLHNRKTTSEQDYAEYSILINYYKTRCLEVCPNEEELCNIVLDLCYQTEHSKQFAWDMCGKTIIRNLLKQNNCIISFPEVVSDRGEFEYCGRQFVMTKKKLEVDYEEIDSYEGNPRQVS